MMSCNRRWQTSGGEKDWVPSMVKPTGEPIGSTILRVANDTPEEGRYVFPQRRFGTPIWYQYLALTYLRVSQLVTRSFNANRFAAVGALCNGPPQHWNRTIL